MTNRVTANPYQPPATRVRDVPAIGLPKHTRPLWLGVVVASFSPAVFIAMPMGAWLSVAVEPIGPANLLASLVMGLIASVPAAVVVGWPLVLLLRWRGWLYGSTVCWLAVLAGALFGGALLSLPSLEASDSLVRGLLLGAASGLVAGLGMVFGAGIPLFRRAAGKAHG